MGKILEKRRNIHQNVHRQHQHIEKLNQKVHKLEPLANLGLAAAMIAHELNNVLTPVLNYAQLAQANPEDTQLSRKAFDKIVHNALKASDIARTVLEIARGSDRQKMHHKLRNLVESTFTCLARDFSKDRIKVIVDIDPDLDIVVDAVAFQQVLMNMILNARQAMMNAPGTLTISALKRSGCVEMQIADTGCGISAEDLPHIFDPFYSTKDSTDSSGSGLGLAYCKRIIDEHRGEIKVDSVEKWGTTFTITIPLSHN